MKYLSILSVAIMLFASGLFAQATRNITVSPSQGYNAFDSITIPAATNQYNLTLVTAPTVKTVGFLKSGPGPRKAQTA